MEDLTRALERNGPLTRAGRSEVLGELRVLRTLVAGGDYPPKARATADAVLANANIQLTPDSPTHRQFCVETAKMLDALWEAYLAHSAGLDGYTEAVTPPAPPVAPAPAPPAPSAQSVPATPSVGIQDVVDAYFAEKRREGAWTEKTEQEQRAVFDLFTKVTGDPSVETITVDTARDYKAVLLKLPANLNKNPLYRGKSIPQVLAMKPDTPMAVNTVNKHLTRVSALFAWAKRHGYVRENFFQGLAC